MKLTGTTAPIAFKGNGFQADTNKEAKLHKACTDFEAIIIKQLLSAMRRTVPEGGLFSGGYAQDMYQSMSDEQLSKELANGRGLGIGEALYRQLAGSARPATGR